jgi:hypothetical protein
MVGQIGESNYGGNDAVRAAQINVSHSNSNTILGPVTYDVDLTVDNLHFKTDAEIQEFARRWYLAISKEFYGGSNGYGPIADLDNIIFDGSKITVQFTDDTSPAIDPSSTVTTTSFKLKNNGSPVSISSVSINGNSIEITPGAVLDLSQPVTLTYASLNTAVEAAVYDNEGLPAENFYDADVDFLMYWTGLVSDDWDVAGNWSGGTVPSNSFDVIIPHSETVPNSPVVHTGSSAVCRKVTLNEGSSLTCIGNLTSSEVE